MGESSGPVCSEFNASFALPGWCQNFGIDWVLMLAGELFRQQRGRESTHHAAGMAAAMPLLLFSLA